MRYEVLGKAGHHWYCLDTDLSKEEAEDLADECQGEFLEPPGYPSAIITRTEIREV